MLFRTREFVELSLWISLKSKFLKPQSQFDEFMLFRTREFVELSLWISLKSKFLKPQSL